MTGNIEFVIGNETHSSSWGKYYVKGLEQWQIKEDFDENRRDRHHSYQGYCANDVPDGTVFTVFEQNGDKRGTDLFIFTIYVVDQGSVGSDKASYGYGSISGNIKVVCSSGNSKTKAPRLMDWWQSAPEADKLAYAEWCKENIDKRGMKTLPPMPEKTKTQEYTEEIEILRQLVSKLGKDKVSELLNGL